MTSQADHTLDLWMEGGRIEWSIRCLARPGEICSFPTADEFPPECWLSYHFPLFTEDELFEETFEDLSVRPLRSPIKFRHENIGTSDNPRVRFEFLLDREEDPGVQRSRLVMRPRNHEIRAVIDAAVAVSGYAPEEIVAQYRGEATLVFVRRSAWYVARNRTTASYPDLGRVFGRHHTSILDGVRAVQSALDRGDRRRVLFVKAIEDVLDGSDPVAVRDALRVALAEVSE